jgi:hypothetical protein
LGADVAVVDVWPKHDRTVVTISHDDVLPMSVSSETVVALEIVLFHPVTQVVALRAGPFPGAPWSSRARR